MQDRHTRAYSTQSACATWHLLSNGHVVMCHVLSAIYLPSMWHVCGMCYQMRPGKLYASRCSAARRPHIYTHSLSLTHTHTLSLSLTHTHKRCSVSCDVVLIREERNSTRGQVLKADVNAHPRTHTPTHICTHIHTSSVAYLITMS